MTDGNKKKRQGQVDLELGNAVESELSRREQTIVRFLEVDKDTPVHTMTEEDVKEWFSED